MRSATLIDVQNVSQDHLSLCVAMFFGGVVVLSNEEKTIANATSGQHTLKSLSLFLGLSTS